MFLMNANGHLLKSSVGAAQDAGRDRILRRINTRFNLVTADMQTQLCADALATDREEYTNHGCLLLQHLVPDYVTPRDWRMKT